MSSKEQYRDALKRKTRVIALQAMKITELNAELHKLSKELYLANKRIENYVRINALRKKWWQFWK